MKLKFNLKNKPELIRSKDTFDDMNMVLVYAHECKAYFDLLEKELREILKGPEALFGHYIPVKEILGDGEETVQSNP